MLSFECDYNNGAHPKVLQHLIDTNSLTSLTYGFDEWSEQARQKIRTACQCPEADIFFLVGGTQANTTVIDGMLQTFEGVIAVQTAHINVHESGAVEASGHKVITLPSHDGKMDAGELKAWLKAFHADPTLEHMVIPGMVYITFPTELGSVYTAKEIEEMTEELPEEGELLDETQLSADELQVLSTESTLPEKYRRIDLLA
jgi:threonine aldolase